MSGKIAVVTGANKGIGFAIVKGLCEKFNGTVYLTARNEARGQAAVKKLKDDYNLTARFHQLDITDQASVNKFKNYLSTTHGGLDVLVNNAGIAFQSNDPTPIAQKAETTVNVNYFGTLRVCEALIPLLRQNARVVNVSSMLGRLPVIPSKALRDKFANPNLTIAELNDLMKKYIQDVKTGSTAGWPGAYEVSKVGVSALTIILQRLFDKEQPFRNISANHCHPGYVNTDLTEHRGPLTVEQGAKAPLYLALDVPQSFKGKFVWYDTSVVNWYSQ